MCMRTIRYNVVWSVVEALQFMEDTNASQHDFQNMIQKRHEHYYSNTESDHCQVRLDFIELVIHPNHLVAGRGGVTLSCDPKQLVLR